MLPTIYEYQAKLCMYPTDSLYSLPLHSMRCRYVSAHRATTSAIQFPFFPSSRPSRSLPDEELAVRPQPTDSISNSLPIAANGTHQSPEATLSTSEISILRTVEILSSMATKLEDAPANDILQNHPLSALRLRPSQEYRQACERL